MSEGSITFVGPMYIADHFLDLLFFPFPRSFILQTLGIL